MSNTDGCVKQRRSRAPVLAMATAAATIGLFTLPATAMAASSHAATQHGKAAAPGQAKKQMAPATSSTSSSGKSDHSQGNAGTNGDPSQPQPPSNADQNSGGANGQCPGGPYCSTRDGSPSGNGSGGGKATGKPCAGCVGKADNKNPPGQMPNGSDHNAGYECDRNHGIGRTNPAHTGCQSSPPPCTGRDCQPCDTETCPPPCDQEQCPPPCQGTECQPCTGGDCSPPPSCEDTNSCTCPSDDSACQPPQQCVPTQANHFCSQVKGVKHNRPISGGLTEGPTVLPFTGSPVAVLLGSGLGLLIVGSLMTVTARRRRRA